MGDMLPGHLPTHILPHPLHRIAFWRTGGQKHPCDVLGYPQSFGGVGTAAVKYQDVEGLTVALGETVHEPLHGGRIMLGQAHNIRFACSRGHPTEAPTVGVLMLNTAYRLYPSSGDAAATDGHQPPPAFVLAPPAQWVTIARWDGRTHLLDQRVAEPRLIGFFMPRMHDLRAGFELGMQNVGEGLGRDRDTVLLKQPHPHRITRAHTLGFAETRTPFGDDGSGNGRSRTRRSTAAQSSRSTAVSIPRQSVAHGLAVNAQKWSQSRPRLSGLAGNEVPHLEPLTLEGMSLLLHPPL